MLTRHAIVLSHLLLLSGAALAGQVRDVGGPSPDHAEIADAVNAAQDGDVIRIWPGTYLPFSIDDKGLSLVSALPSGGVEVAGTFRVKNLAGQRTVTLHGIGAHGTDGLALVVSDCQGSVRVRNGTYQGAAANGSSLQGKSAIYILNSADVELVDCCAQAGNSASGESSGAGAAGMLVQASYVALYASTFVGSSGNTDDDPGASGLPGGDGISSWGGGRTYLSGCTLTGGDGGWADWDVDFWTNEYGYGGAGGDGYSCWDGSVEAWFLDNTYLPGVGGWSPDATQLGGDGAQHSAGTELPGTSRVLRAAALRDDQSNLDLRFQGAPGDQAYLQVFTGASSQFDPQLGPLLIARPALPQVLPWRILGGVDANGSLMVSLPLRDLPALEHRTLHLQGLMVGQQSYYTSSGWTVILDSAW